MFCAVLILSLSVLDDSLCPECSKKGSEECGEDSKTRDSDSSDKSGKLIANEDGTYRAVCDLSKRVDNKLTYELVELAEDAALLRYNTTDESLRKTAEAVVSKEYNLQGVQLCFSVCFHCHCFCKN